jgi:ATP-dependent DNA ligase
MAARCFRRCASRRLEGVVAKRLNEPYRPGVRAWIKTKNREYWRYEMEREGALKVKRERQFV